MKTKVARSNVLNLDNPFKLVVVLTQYKRQNLKKQIMAVKQQTLKPDIIIVFQNDRHEEVSSYAASENIYLVRSDFNTKYFGRFAYCLGLKADYVIIMDDDIIPGVSCFEHYVSQVEEYNGIMGANGRIANLNSAHAKLKKPKDVGIRDQTVEVDFVGHLWCFKHEWLRYMFMTPISTLETGEDMHFCFSAKLHGGIRSFAASQPTERSLSDTKYNYLGIDAFASYKTTPLQIRTAVEEYFVRYGLEFIESN